jgi:hypothetical protein
LKQNPEANMWDENGQWRRVIKSRRLVWAGYVDRMEEGRVLSKF